MRLAFFVTPHGLGHAARAAALIEALAAARPDARFVILTQAPRWLFAESVSARFECLPVSVDVGLVQRDAMTEDLPATVRRLQTLVPPPDALVADLAEQLRRRGVQGVVCDIAPLGLAVARALGVPSVLVENFTWDWIYQGYLEQEPGLGRFVEPLREAFAAADVRIQPRPRCVPAPAARAVGPIGRTARLPAGEVRARLGVAAQQRLVLLTMGGLDFARIDLEQLARQQDAVVALTDGGSGIRREGSLRRLPRQGAVYLPDVVAASDMVVGKLGYSTVAEAALAGVPMVSMGRPAFREAAVLAEYVVGEMGGVILSQEAFLRGEWLSRVPPRRAPVASGAADAARIVLEAVG